MLFLTPNQQSKSTLGMVIKKLNPKQTRNRTSLYKTPLRPSIAPWLARLTIRRSIKSVLLPVESLQEHVAYSWSFCANMTSSVIPKAHDVSQRRRRRTEPRSTCSMHKLELDGKLVGNTYAWACTCAQTDGQHENILSPAPFIDETGHAVSEISSQTDRQTQTNTHTWTKLDTQTCSSQCFSFQSRCTPPPEKKSNSAVERTSLLLSRGRQDL